MRCGVVRFVRFSYYKTANHTAPCSVVWCGALLLAMRCCYAILQAVLVQFMQFGEHNFHLIRFYKINLVTQVGLLAEDILGFGLNPSKLGTHRAFQTFRAISFPIFQQSHFSKSCLELIILFQTQDPFFFFFSP